MTYSDAEAAALYGVLNAWAASDDFYLELIMSANAVLDVGCGTGTLLHRARESGHTGRLCGVDPDVAMLDVARQRSDIEWSVGTAASMTWSGEFDLAVMSGHAFQCFVADEDLRASLAAIRTALEPGGRFAFETRNPLVREWESWNPSNPIDTIDPTGRAIRMVYFVESVVGDVVTFTESTCEPDGTPLRVDRASLRFLDAEKLAEFLSEAGFQIEAQYGDWDRSPFTPASREIITVARR
jgi:ubiquinone/menaquinone biosynthesis C-methylase UbiE